MRQIGAESDLPDTKLSHSTKDVVYKYVDENRDEAVKFYQDVIRTKSVTAGLGYDQGNEKDLAVFLEDYMKKIGMQVAMIEPHPKRTSIVGTLKGSVGKPRLAFYAHLDVVPVDKESKWKYPPFAAEIHDGRLYGRGASDMKTGLAASLFAAKVLKDVGISLKGDLLCAYGAGEEQVYPYGLKALISQGLLKADFCIYPHGGIPEDPKMPFAADIGTRGLLFIQVKTKGKVEHLSAKEAAVNAIVKMCTVAKAIDNMSFTPVKPHHVVPGGIDIAPTIITAGFQAVSASTVPDECTAMFDCRFTFGATKDMIVGDIQRVINQLKANDPELNVEVEVLRETRPSFIEPDAPLVDAIKKVWKEFDPKRPFVVAGARYDGDAVHFNEAGIPVSLTLGAAGYGDHEPNEWNHIEGYVSSIKMLCSIAINLLS